MKKRVSALVIAMLVFICSSSYTFAAESDIIPYGSHVHEFNRCSSVGSEYQVSEGLHTYLYGIDHNGEKIYRSDCHLYSVYQNCKYICKLCSTVEPGGGQHKHFIRFEHSIVHP